MKTRLLATLLCDDVRREDSNKLIIIGLYGSDITFPKPSKLALPKVCVLQRWEVGEPGHSCRCEIVEKESGRQWAKTGYDLRSLSPRGYHTNVFQILGPVFEPVVYVIRTFLGDRLVDEQELEVKTTTSQ